MQTVEQHQAELFNLVDLDHSGREIFRAQISRAGLNSADYIKPPRARARYIWLASRGPEVPKPKPLHALLNRPDRGPTYKLTVQQMAQRMAEHYADMAKRIDGPVVVHLFPETGSRNVADFNTELRGCLNSGALGIWDRVQIEYVNAAEWGFA